MNDFHPNLDRALDYVRLEIGDTGPDVFLLNNDTIAAMLKNPAMDYNQVVAKLVSGLIARFGQSPKIFEQKNGVKIDTSDRLPAWKLVLSQAKAGSLVDPSGTVAAGGSGSVQVGVRTEF